MCEIGESTAFMAVGFSQDDLGRSAVAAHLEPTVAADFLIEAMSETLDPQPRKRLVDVLSSVALSIPQSDKQRGQRATIFGTGTFATPSSFLPSLPLLHPHFHPQPRPLPAQTLVELLKHPFCVGEARRAVLDALEFTYQRKFADQWEFVKYAQKHQKHLDLLTPPKRPAQP